MFVLCIEHKGHIFAPIEKSVTAERKGIGKGERRKGREHKRIYSGSA